MGSSLFKRPDCLEPRSQFLRYPRQLGNGERGPKTIVFIAYCANPAFVIVEDRRGIRIRCPRDELFLMTKGIESVMAEMDEPGFRDFLKKKGKQNRVIDGLVREVRQLEAHLAGPGGVSLSGASERFLEAYARRLSSPEIKRRMRAVDLYFQFAGLPALASAAGRLREREVAKTRRPFQLRGFRGVDLAAVARLEEVGITNVAQLLAAGRSPEARQQLAVDTGVALETILELVRLSDLSRIGALKSVRARLYYDAGLRTPAEIAKWDPGALYGFLASFVSRTGFEGIAPLPKEVRSAVEKARMLPEIVRYE